MRFNFNTCFCCCCCGVPEKPKTVSPGSCVAVPLPPALYPRARGGGGGIGCARLDVVRSHTRRITCRRRRGETSLRIIYYIILYCVSFIGTVCVDDDGGGETSPKSATGGDRPLGWGWKRRRRMARRSVGNIYRRRRRISWVSGNANQTLRRYSDKQATNAHCTISRSVNK